jgi:hypothetical protein
VGFDSATTPEPVKQAKETYPRALCRVFHTLCSFVPKYPTFRFASLHSTWGYCYAVCFADWLAIASISEVFQRTLIALQLEGRNSVLKVEDAL